jgi:GntR family transcriptional regulator
MTATIGPSYQLVADDIRTKLRKGELHVGEAIPSTAKLMEQYGVSSTVIRHAVAELRAEGVLVGHSGKAVYVQAMPRDEAAERQDLHVLGEQVGELRSEVRELTERVDAVQQSGELIAQVAELRDMVARMQAQIIDLHARLGYPYPRDEASRSRKAAGGASRQGRSA